MSDEPTDPDDPNPSSERLRRGRWNLGVYTVLVIAVSALTIGSYVVYVGPNRLPPQIVRFILTCLLMWWLWSGSLIARWITIILLGTGGALAALFLVVNTAPLPFHIVKALMTAAYLPLVFNLIAPTAIRDYLEWQRIGPRWSPPD